MTSQTFLFYDFRFQCWIYNAKKNFSKETKTKRYLLIHAMSIWRKSLNNKYTCLDGLLELDYKYAIVVASKFRPFSIHLNSIWVSRNFINIHIYIHIFNLWRFAWRGPILGVENTPKNDRHNMVGILYHFLKCLSVNFER